MTIREHPALGWWMAFAGAFGFSFKAVLVKLAYRYGVDAEVVAVVVLHVVDAPDGDLPCVAVLVAQGARHSDEVAGAQPRAGVDS